MPLITPAVGGATWPGSAGGGLWGARAPSPRRPARGGAFPGRDAQVNKNKRRAAAQRSLAAKDDFLQLLRPTTGRDAENAGKHFDHGIGKGHVMFFVELENVSREHLLGHQKKRHVADDFAGRRNFDDVAEELV